MDEQINPVVRFIAEMSKQIFERNIRGQIDYENDLKAFQKYRDMAHQANAPRQEARIVNLMAVMNSISGHLSLAEEQFTLAFVLNQELGDKFGVVTALNNKAFFLTSLGRYEEATDLYLQGIAICESSPDETLRAYLLVLSGYLAICYMREEYDQMPAYFEKIQAIQDDYLTKHRKHTSNYATVMTEVYRSMAEYYLYRKDYNQAKSMIGTGLEFAKELSLTFELADLHHTQAHIALAVGDIDSANTHWAKAIEILEDVPAKSNVGRNYNQEARYLDKRGYGDYGQRFAKYAYDIFESLQMKEDAKLAEVLL
ncbi:MAG: tetratricopeptide repeat protein [bacterium]|nr:tetratricopeptide repeat protein [bacterium]